MAHDINVVTMGAGENVIGKVGAPDDMIEVTPTLTTGAYTSGDLLFDSTEIANAVRVNGGTAIVQSIIIIDKDDQKMDMTLVFANAETDFGTINSTPDPTDAETATIVGQVAVTATYVDWGDSAVAQVPTSDLGFLVKADAGTTSLYLAAMTNDAPTHAANGLVIRVGLLRS